MAERRPYCASPGGPIAAFSRGPSPACRGKGHHPQISVLTLGVGDGWSLPETREQSPHRQVTGWDYSLVYAFPCLCLRNGQIPHEACFSEV